MTSKKENGVPSEHFEQREFVKWFRQTFNDMRIFAIPNGGMRGKSEAAKLKAEGVSSGVPDLYVPAIKLWIEMKKQVGGKLSATQKDWIKYLDEIGDHVIVGYGCDDAKNKVNAFLQLK